MQQKMSCSMGREQFIMAKARTLKKRRGAPAPRTEEVRGGAFMSQYLTMCKAEGMQPDNTVVAAEYKAISDAQDDKWEELTAMGRSCRNKSPEAIACCKKS